MSGNARLRRSPLLACTAAALVAFVLSGCGVEPTEGGELATDAGAGVHDAPSLPPPPDGWTCDERWWGEGWCDCGCGVVDELDCPEGVASEIESCIYNACQGNQRPNPWNTLECEFNFWSCNPDHVFAEQLPRRHPIPLSKQPPEKP